jgi:hypothetical protein
VKLGTIFRPTQSLETVEGRQAAEARQLAERVRARRVEVARADQLARARGNGARPLRSRLARPRP